MLIATRMLGTGELLELNLTSRATHDGVVPEIGRRRVTDIVRCFDKQLALEARDIAATLACNMDAPDLRRLSADLLARGRHAQAEAAAHASIAEHPEQPLNHEQLARVLLQANPPGEAVVAAEAALPCDPAGERKSLLLARAHLLAGDPAKARAALPSPDASPYEVALLDVMIDHSMGRTVALAARVEAALHRASHEVFVRPSLMAEAYAWIGDAPNAMLWIERAARYSGDRELLRVALSPFSAPLAHNPMWQLLRRAAQRTLDGHKAPVHALFVHCETDTGREPLTSSAPNVSRPTSRASSARLR